MSILRMARTMAFPGVIVSNIPVARGVTGFSNFQTSRGLFNLKYSLEVSRGEAGGATILLALEMSERVSSPMSEIVALVPKSERGVEGSNDEFSLLPSVLE